MKRLLFLAFLSLAGGLGYYLANPGPGGTAMRFRLIVEVNTPEGVKFGSSVIEYRVHDGTKGAWGPMEARTVRNVMTGEAVFIDLGQGKSLIALLAAGPTAQGDLTRIVQETFGELKVEDYGRYQSMTGAREVPQASRPTMVTFTDLTDPASAKVVYTTGRDVRLVQTSPSSSSYKDFGPLVIDRFAETFGPGYALRRVTIEMTADPITKGIEGRLPWWNKPGRPAEIAYRAMRQGQRSGASIEPELLFKRGE